MSDVKILAPLSARGTGIPRTSTQVPQRNPTGTANSHVSASPSAGPRAQAQVASVRRPPQRRLDATVVILDRPATRSPATVQPMPAAAGGAAPAGAASQLPTVQIVERTRPGTAAAAFTVEQMMLIGFLLDRYRENTMAISDAVNTAVADGALAVLGGLLQAAGAPVPPAQTMVSQAPIADERDQAGAGQGAVEASSASSTSITPSSPADSSPSGGDGIPNSPATPTGEREST